MTSIDEYFTNFDTILMFQIHLFISELADKNQPKAGKKLKKHGKSDVNPEQKSDSINSPSTSDPKTSARKTADRSKSKVIATRRSTTFT